MRPSITRFCSAALAALVLSFVFAGCATTSAAGGDHQAPHAASRTTAQLMKQRDLVKYVNQQSDGDALRNGVDAAWPHLLEPGGDGQIAEAALLAAGAGWATKELVNWFGSAIENEAKKYTGQFSACLDDPNWIMPGSSVPSYVAIKLSRDANSENEFTAIVLIRPILRHRADKADTIAIDRSAYQLVPVYWKETKAVAEHSTNKLGGVLSVSIAGVWPSSSQDPVSATLASYCVTLPSYEIGHAIYFHDGADGTKVDGPAFSSASHYFVMPGHPAALTVTIGVVETDNGKWPKILEKIGEALSNEADAASTAVKARIPTK